MQRKYSTWQLIILTVVLVIGTIFAYNSVTNPKGMIWCVRSLPNGDEVRLRGADCTEPIIKSKI